MSATTRMALLLEQYGHLLGDRRIEIISAETSPGLRGMGATLVLIDDYDLVMPPPEPPRLYDIPIPVVVFTHEPKMDKLELPAMPFIERERPDRHFTPKALRAAARAKRGRR